MDGGADGDILLLTYAERFHYLGVPFKPLAYPRIHGVRGDAVRVNADNLVDFGGYGDFWKKGAVYRDAKILSKNRCAVRVEISMEGDCVFHSIVGDFSYLPKSGVAGIFDSDNGIFVHCVAIFFKYTLYGSGNGTH